ncbi:2,3-bisphosphoglycerate-dependent phosphoglycerate mutase [Methylobacterium haplocladii]|uniref:2,3-bisphosphoglycerate-dependent phosphoglycerate mutase n=2 Tax=Methylobacterium haplocladii TaxID=1176176 RepID=A0A512INH7_9HYPH|nr:2,3-bisphosphoglycerate-dependent phosphoglycerate mutase [Methylobacterium haplocladii]GEO99263.1 2,3-bisphosphoglycerate-dependent phosphoglycerate mutase [Methylobacterium haplocladii]
MNLGPRSLILVRHGESTANAAGAFTGRLDVPLTERGREQARAVGRRLSERELAPDRVFCSSLSRTRATAELILEVLEQRSLEPEGLDTLDERDYGVLTGLDMPAAVARWGADRVETWRRSYADGPPQGESLRDTLARITPCLLRQLLPAALRGTALVVAHGNALRAVVMAMEGLGPDAVERLEIPTGSIRIYTLAADATIEAVEFLP